MIDVTRYPSPEAAGATVIYAVPPALRLTTLGIRQVSPQAVAAARAFGSTRRQVLLKVLASQHPGLRRDRRSAG